MDLSPDIDYRQAKARPRLSADAWIVVMMVVGAILAGCALVIGLIAL